MRVIDVSFREPERNLALDQVLLDNAEERAGCEVLRFWESPIPFVVLGVSQKLEQEVDEEACCRDKVPILRRCSAGGWRWCNGSCAARRWQPLPPDDRKRRRRLSVRKKLPETDRARRRAPARHWPRPDGRLSQLFSGFGP